MNKIKYVISFVLFLGLVSGASVAKEVSGFDVPDFFSDNLLEITGYESFSDIIEVIVNGETPVDEGFFSKIAALVLGDVKLSLTYVVSVIAFSVLSSLVKGSQLRLSAGSGEIAYLICYFLVAGFLLGILQTAVKTALDIAHTLEGFIRMALPAYIGIVTTCGYDFSGSQSLFLMMINVVSSFAGDFMINAFFYMGILGVISNMSDEIHISKLISIFRQTLFWILGFLLTVFASLTALSGINASQRAGAGMRAVKYTVGKSVPLVGGFLSESAELIYASVHVFKGAFGTGGILVIFALCLVPVLKLFVMGTTLKIASGLVEPFCAGSICDSIYRVGQTIIHIMVAVLLMSVMFILAFAVLLMCGGTV